MNKESQERVTESQQSSQVYSMLTADPRLTEKPSPSRDTPGPAPRRLSPYSSPITASAAESKRDPQRAEPRWICVGTTLPKPDEITRNSARSTIPSRNC